MGIMLKKFRTRLQRVLQKRTNLKEIDFENQNIKLDGKDYLFCRAVVPAIPEMLSVERAVYNGKTPTDYSVFEKQLNDQARCLVLLVRFEDRVVAYVACDYQHSEARITDIAIMPRFQGRGIATKMLQIILKEAEKMGSKLVALDVRQSNLQGQKFYKELGFEKEKIKHRYFADNDENAYEFGYTFKGEK